MSSSTGYRLDACPTCDAPDAFFSLDKFDRTCGGVGKLYCRCAGDDACLCHNHSEVDCPGCDDCLGFGDEIGTDPNIEAYADAFSEAVEDE